MIQRSVTRDWSSFTPDLIRHVGDLLLATSDVDGYMDMRAVCRGWRSTVADPRQHGTADLRFCPRQWIMLDDDDNFDEGRLFVNISTGRFVRRPLPLLCTDHALVGASDGLLVLADSREPHACHLLNPFTGHITRFAAQIQNLRIGFHFHIKTVVAAAGSDPMLLFVTTGANGRPQAWFADPALKGFYCRPTPAGAGSTLRSIAATVAYAGQIYMAYSDGSVYRSVGSSAQHGHEELVIAASNPKTEPEAVFLVESAGELLLVLRHSQPWVFRVFRVDVEGKALEPATGIDGRALFLGPRCLSVAADKFPGIEGDCLYYATSLYDRQCSELHCMYRFSLKGSWEAMVWSNMDPSISGYRERMRVLAYRPLCIARVFLAYCLDLPHVKAQLMR